MISGARSSTGFCLHYVQHYCNRKFIMSTLLVIPNWFMSRVDSMEILSGVFFFPMEQLGQMTYTEFFF